MNGLWFIFGINIISSYNEEKNVQFVKHNSMIIISLLYFLHMVLNCKYQSFLLPSNASFYLPANLPSFVVWCEISLLPRSHGLHCSYFPSAVQLLLHLLTHLSIKKRSTSTWMTRVHQSWLSNPDCPCHLFLFLLLPEDVFFSLFNQINTEILLWSIRKLS